MRDEATVTRIVMYFAPHPGVKVLGTSVRRCRHFDVEVHTLRLEVEYPVDDGDISCMLSCRYYEGTESETVRINNLKREKLLSSAHIFEPKPSWLILSVHVGVKLLS